MSRMRVWITAATCLAMTVLGGATSAWAADEAGDPPPGAQAQGAQAHEALLADERWEELAYGLSLRPWPGARTIEPPPPGMLAQFVGEHFRLRVFIREAGQGQERRAQQRAPGAQHQERPRAQQGQRHSPELDIRAVMEWAPRQLAFTNPGARVLEDEQRLMRIAGRPGARLVYWIPSAESMDPESVWTQRLHERLVNPDHARDWVLAQAFMQIDPYTVVRFELDADVRIKDQALAVFDAVLASVRMTDPQELDERRSQWIEQGAAWIANLDPTQREERLVPEQWFRVLADGEDVGYRRVIQEPGTNLGLAGIRVEVAEHMRMDGEGFDRYSEYFESLDGRTEVWSTRTARRGGDPDGRLPAPLAQGTTAAAETGLRTGRELNVSTEAPEQLDQEQWPELPDAYLSQVNVHLLPPLLPRDAQRTMALYAYHGDSKRVALRIFTLVPLEDGGFRIHQRPAPEHREDVATYDAEGHLIQHRLADGRVLVPTTAEQIEAIWEEPSE